MITHSADSRGRADHGWLFSRHTFSFADYYDPERMGFGTLRVINDDKIAPEAGFGRHHHRDMEIITIPLEGTLEHRDSEGHQSKINKGEVQVMSAGTGIFHSEYNASTFEPVKLLQIWVLPKLQGVSPRYEQSTYDLVNGQLTLIVSPHGKGGKVTINQDAYFSLGLLEAGKDINYRFYAPNQGLYVFVISGEVMANKQVLRSRDAIGITGEQNVQISALSTTEVLLMEVPMTLS